MTAGQLSSSLFLHQKLLSLCILDIVQNSHTSLYNEFLFAENMFWYLINVLKYLKSQIEQNIQKSNNLLNSFTT